MAAIGTRFVERLIRAWAWIWIIAVTIGAAAGANDDWVLPMKEVHARFTGSKGTFAQFGDSITITMAFWTPVAGTPKKMNEEAAHAHSIVKKHIDPACWAKWKGPAYGNNGSMTIRWADENVDAWLQKLNPEEAVIMFGSNDVGQMEAAEYEQRLRRVVARCLQNGTVVLLTTAPPRSGRIEKSRAFAEVVRKVARESKVPLVDYFGEILKRRPEDWDGSLPQFKSAGKDVYQVPTLIARDGVHPSNPKEYENDFSEEALRRNGFALRNYLTMRAYAEVIANVF